jgi:hypothetical protein
MRNHIPIDAPGASALSRNQDPERTFDHLDPCGKIAYTRVESIGADCQ